MFTALLITALLAAAGNTGKPDLKTPYEKGNGNQTATYQETINWYQQLDAAYEEVKMLPYGTIDACLALHLVIVSTDKDFDAASVHQKNKRILLVHNGIHPGEPESIDATMILARNYLQDKNCVNSSTTWC